MGLFKNQTLSILKKFEQTRNISMTSQGLANVALCHGMIDNSEKEAFAEHLSERLADYLEGGYTTLYEGSASIVQTILEADGS